MPNQLRDIRKFTDLVRYLESELEWPVETGSFDDLTFEYQPAELGLKDEDAVKIKKIHQLRPLASGQPWGIFFVEFEKKKLPVIVLRRILSHLILKKRQSANKADQAAWNPHDLLFISAFGDEASDQREIAFAHFHTQAGGDLPTLRILGWDGGDTPLKLDYVASELQTKLHWPQNPADQNAWRAQWSSAFRNKLGHTIKTADVLAEVLAGLAKRIRDAAKRLMKAESENGPLTKLYKGFQTALIHDLKPDDFADTYAQTITYGLLTAAISRTEMSEGARGTVLFAENVTDMVPVTNPFLKEMLQTFLKVGGRKGGIDFDELGIQDVVELLRGEETDLPAILRDFGNKTRGEDPVIHFYEHFLSAYNKQLKIQRGVFYTPQPVVSYIVRSVHELLQTEFGLEDGLASTATWGEMLAKNPHLKLPSKSGDPGDKATIAPGEMFVQILDPATGTATFLVEVIDVIHRTLKAKWDQGGLKAMPKLPPTSFPRQPADFGGYWNQYVPLALLPRLHGYELMMAPYAIAHMKIGLKLHETGYHFGTEERARIYLTNALEPKVTQLPQIGFDALAHEAAAVNEIKWYKRFTVIIGNPPYAQYSMNLNEAAKAHIEKFRFANGQKIRARNALQLERNLNDDYVKFLGLSSDLFPLGTGILGMITNRMFLDSESLVGLREWFATNFDRVCIVDLWGSSEESRRVARLAEDENVFDILQGVAVSFSVRRRVRSKTANPVRSREVIGKREDKYKLLFENLALDDKSWEQTTPEPEWWWLHRNASDSGSATHEFTLAEIFPQFSTLVASNRDHLVVDFDRDVVLQKVKAVQAFRGTNEKWAEQFNITLKTGWNVTAAREKLSGIRDIGAHIKTIEYRAFDRRWIFFHPTLVWQSAPVSSNNVLRGSSNRVLISLGKNRAETTNGHWVAATLADKSVVSTRDNASGFPLYLYDDGDELNLGGNSGRPNISPEFLRELSKCLSIPQTKPHGLPDGVTPEDIFHYTYGVFHSPGYRSRYAEFLKIDFPRLPLTGKLELFRALARLGGELTALHLLESPKLAQPITEYLGGRSPAVEKISWSKNTVWLDKAQTTGFQGVREDVWNFHIGGYQVCEKWLKDRKGRTLSAADQEHYQKIVVALSETIRLMKEIDDVIEKYGGWPLK